MSDLVTGHPRMWSINRLPARVAIISCALLVPAVIAGILAVWRVGDLTGAGVVTAFAACWAGSVFGYVLSVYPQGDEFIVSRLMASMAVRAGLPLAAAVIPTRLLDAGFGRGYIYLIVLLYVVGLICDSLLNLKQMRGEARTTDSVSRGDG